MISLSWNFITGIFRIYVFMWGVFKFLLFSNTRGFGFNVVKINFKFMTQIIINIFSQGELNDHVMNSSMIPFIIKLIQIKPSRISKVY